jgi:hypothetical protein
MVERRDFKIIDVEMHAMNNGDILIAILQYKWDGDENVFDNAF